MASGCNGCRLAARGRAPPACALPSKAERVKDTLQSSPISECALSVVTCQIGTRGPSCTGGRRGLLCESHKCARAPGWFLLMGPSQSAMYPKRWCGQR